MPEHGEGLLEDRERHQPGADVDAERAHRQWQQPDAAEAELRAGQARRLIGRRPVLKGLAAGASLLFVSAHDLQDALNADRTVAQAAEIGAFSVYQASSTTTDPSATSTTTDPSATSTTTDASTSTTTESTSTTSTTTDSTSTTSTTTDSTSTTSTTTDSTSTTSTTTDSTSTTSTTTGATSTTTGALTTTTGALTTTTGGLTSTTAAPTTTVAATFGASGQEDGNKDDSSRSLTSLEREQKEKTNKGGLDDDRIEGNVIAVDTQSQPPTITIGTRDGLVILRLSGDATKVTVRVGDYIVAHGEKQHELLYDITDVDID